MPGFVAEALQRSPRLTVTRVRCDGADPARPHDEHCEQDGLWVVLSGSFTVRTQRGLERMDPMAAMRWRTGMAYQVRHDHGGDVCLSVRGPIAAQLAERGTGALRLDEAQFVDLRRACRGLDAGDASAPLALEAALVSAASRDDEPVAASARTRRLAEALAHTLRARFDEKVSLDDLAQEHDISPFHACAAFRAATGTSLHQYHLEVRLRHALAWVLDTKRPIGELALDAGFASQAHLTTRFRNRYGVTPARCRRTGLP